MQVSVFNFFFSMYMCFQNYITQSVNIALAGPKKKKCSLTFCPCFWWKL